jgi:hypothetical protein
VPSLDCHGPGQEVTQTLFGGASWQGDPALLGPMIRAFAVMRPAREVLGLVRQAKHMALPASEALGLAVVESALDPAGGWTGADVESGAVQRATAAARAFLRSLAPRLECAAAEIRDPGS